MGLSISAHLGKKGKIRTYLRYYKWASENSPGFSFTLPLISFLLFGDKDKKEEPREVEATKK